jgi:RimJ/RimL family protein N-acetyltransferase
MSPERIRGYCERERTLYGPPCRASTKRHRSPNSAADPLPLTRFDEAQHARASNDAADALRDTRAAEIQWEEHGFGPWAIRDRADDCFLGSAELRFAGAGIEGIAPDEVEAGWWVTANRRNEGIATEAMQAAVADLWTRTDVDSITAYIEDGENEPSRRLAVKLGFTVRGSGRGRSGEPMTVYELRRDTRHRRYL